MSTGRPHFAQQRGQLFAAFLVLASSASAQIYVADNGNNRIVQLNSSGAFVQAIGVQFPPYAMAVDASGNFWVVDRGGSRVVEFSSNGTPLLQFGSQGGGPGQFSNPSALAIDASGNIFVVDLSNARVQEFTHSGAYVTQFGGGGSGNRQLNMPDGIAIDSSGNIWIAEDGNDRMQAFTSGIAFLRTIVPGFAPYAIAFDPSGNLWAVDRAGDQIVKYATNGTRLLQVGSQGGGPGQFMNPSGITADSNGNVWVTDLSNQRVQEFSNNGAFIGQFGGFGSGPGQFNGPQGVFAVTGGATTPPVVGITVTPQTGSLTANQQLPLTATVTGTSNTSVNWTILFGGAGTVTSSGLYMAPSAIASQQTVTVQAASGADPTKTATATITLVPATVSGGGTGNIYVADNGNNRIVVLSGSGAFVQAIGVGFPPYAVAVDANGNLWVVDRGGRVVEFSPSGTPVLQIGSQGGGNGQFSNPSGIAIDAGGNIFVADLSNARIQKFSSSGVYITQFGGGGSGNGQMNMPDGIAFDSSGNIWVSEDGNNRMQQFTNSGAFIRKIVPGFAPDAIAVDAADNVWVANRDSDSLYKYAPDGTFLLRLGSLSGNAAGQFDNPTGVSIDSNGNIWVNDLSNQRIQWFSANGAFLGQIGGYGSGNGQFSSPQAIFASKGGTATPVVGITVTPTAGSLTANQQLQLTATVTGTSNTSVNWSILFGGAGTVSNSGLYMAPPSITSQQTATVQGASAADPSKTATATITLLPVTPLTVSISAPASGISVAGTILVSANVFGAHSGSTPSVQFLLDGANLGAAVASPPYNYSFDTTLVPNGAHTLTAFANDFSGNQATSAPVQITVNNVTSSSCAAPGNNVFTGCYYSGINFDTFVFMRTDPAIHFDWSGTGPRGPVQLGPDHYSVRWQGAFQFNGGNYQFSLNMDDGDALYIDGVAVYSNWTDHGDSLVQVNVPLTAGTHVIRLDYYQDTGSAIAELSWSPGQ